MSDYIQLNGSVGKFATRANTEKKAHPYTLLCVVRVTYIHMQVHVERNTQNAVELWNMHDRHFIACARKQKKIV